MTGIERMAADEAMLVMIKSLAQIPSLQIKTPLKGVWYAKEKMDDKPENALCLTELAVVASLLNPKLSLFFLAFLPQFITAGDAHPMQSMLIRSAIFAAMTFIVFSLYGIFSSAVSHRVLGNHRVLFCIRWGIALAFTTIGIQLVMT